MLSCRRIQAYGDASVDPLSEVLPPLLRAPVVNTFADEYGSYFRILTQHLVLGSCARKQIVMKVRYGATSQ